MSRLTLVLAAVVSLLLLALPAAGADVKLDFLYNLSDFTGPIPSSWVSFGVDNERNELYVINPSDQSVGVFNKNGLVVHTFGDEGEFGAVMGLAVDESGTIYLLAYEGQRYGVARADFRGELQGHLNLTGLPPLFTENFSPNRIFYHQGRLYLADTHEYKVLMVDRQGNYQDGFAFASMINVNFKRRSDYDIRGFTVDRDGNIIFAIPVISQVFVISPDRKVNSFGRRGSSPGKFNVIGGVAADDKGYLYVADTLRCVIMVFDRSKDFAFRGEFGYRGWDPGNLIAPMEVAVLGDKVYVAQSANRGVSVYRIDGR